MLCPCCGGKIERTALECACGGRFIGNPLDETPIKVQRLGPAFTAVSLLLVIAASALLFTKWLALGAVLVIWSAWRAMKLARREPEWYGGYRSAAAVLVVALVSGAAASGFAIARISEVIENREAQQKAATVADIYHVYVSLEEYKGRHDGSYPSDAQTLKRATGESLPADDWGRAVRYTSYTEAIAGRTPEMLAAFRNFELRSAGPDGEMGTEDDLVMVDGILVTNPSEIKLPIAKDSTGR
ncbi:MAG TPA: hypothetical protein VJH03_20825 [Blastocatellia bacterium]|nr:hypothetical protein [Blastocatellia bacterium]